MSTTRMLTLELQATPEEVMRAVEHLRAFGREHQVDEKALFGLALALEECGANIVHYACNDQAHERFCVTFERGVETLTIELRDHGPAFDPTSAGAREPAATDDDLSPGGWGIHLVRQYMDEIRYTREDDENVLRMVKRLAPQAS
jgi:serine/threonine-protein kinase RsbW